MFTCFEKKNKKKWREIQFFAKYNLNTFHEYIEYKYFYWDWQLDAVLYICKQKNRLLSIFFSILHLFLTPSRFRVMVYIESKFPRWIQRLVACSKNNRLLFKVWNPHKHPLYNMFLNVFPSISQFRQFLCKSSSIILC